MYKNKQIGVIIRAHNEEDFIFSVVKSVPPFIDTIYIVNDASTDKTLDIITKLSETNSKIVIINNIIRGGAGFAAVSGQKRALMDNNEIVVMVDGDGQMDTSRFSDFLDPLISGEADYTKGNRFSEKKHLQGMPAWRRLGNKILTFLTRISSGYWKISDPQNGYTAIKSEILKKIDLDKINRGFAYENDMLVKLNVIKAKVVDVPHPAIYGDQNSKIRYPKFIVATSWLLFEDFFWRIWKKYVSAN